MKKYFAPEYSKEIVVSKDILTASTNGVSKNVETVYGDNGEELGSKTTYSFSLKNFLNF